MTGDPYRSLRPPLATPDDELCSCAGPLPIMLQAHLSSNPLSCIACNLEVPPERIGFSAALAGRLAAWQKFHDCFYLLWLDSQEFEAWARAQLENPDSRINKRGLELVKELCAHCRAYYSWFQAEGEDDFQPLSCCPICRREFVEEYKRRVCHTCRIVVAN